MTSLTLLLQLLVVPSYVWSSVQFRYRHYGGSLTFTPKGRNSDGTYEVELRNKQTHYNCYRYSFQCTSGNCGSQTSVTTTTIARNSYAYSWCLYEVVMRRKLSSNRPFEIRYPPIRNFANGHGYWMPNVRSSRGLWRMLAHVDLGTRSDTGESNRSPITAALPFMRVPKNCPRTFNLPVFDPDGDRVRCRVPTHTSECSPCGLIRGFSLDQDTCALTFSYSVRTGFHPFELMVEDFPKNNNITVSYSDASYTWKPTFAARSRRHASTDHRYTTTTAPMITRGRYQSSIAPLSKIPLQFIVNVDSYHAPSCLDGDYIPIFLSPTPRNGVNLPAFVNTTLEIKVRSTAKYTKILDLIITGPSGISKQRIAADEYVIKWTPTDNHLNDHFPICFVSEARYGSSGYIYHSALRCVIADVGHHDAIVTCNETAIKVEVEKTYLIRRNEDILHLNDFRDPACNLTKLSNRTHVVAVMSLGTCGTNVEEDQANIIFKNEITSADPSEIISRKHDVEIAFSCVYPKRTNLTLGFRHKNPYAFTEKGFGTFTFQFEFFESERFRKQKTASTYPVEVYLKQMIFMQIEATTSIPNTELFVESCRATPYDNPNSRITYSIIENGCVNDNTVQIYPGSKSQFRFGMEAFEFIGAHDEVYITCSVILCETGVPGTRCTQGCIRSNSGNRRQKREASAQTGRHSISQGPLHLVKTSDSQGFVPSLTLGANLVLIVGCLLVCVVAIYNSRKCKAQYKPLPTSESN